MSQVLIAYYSWTGTTAKLAQQIKSLLPNAKLLELKVASETFSADMNRTAEIAKQQIAQNHLPKIITQLPNFTQYDQLLVGGPVWNYGLSTPIISFLKSLAGYRGTVAPFYTDAGDSGDYEEQFQTVNQKLNIVSGNENGKNLGTWVQQFN